MRMSDDEPTRRVGGEPRDDLGDAPTIRALRPEQGVFGRYLLRNMLGRGGMGVVWSAHDVKLDREIALKFLPEMVRNDADAVRELKRETLCCLQVTHANIVRVYDFIEDGTMAAIAMEFVGGKSMSAWKAAHPEGYADVTELAPLVAQLCAALDYAHTTARIVHRDLKPANLLVTPDGLLKVTDFGIARSLVETKTRLDGQDCVTGGTLAYMSPQQLLGLRAVPADDIYALGVTLYELLAGKTPFYTGSIITQIQETPATSLNARRAEFGIAEPVPQAWEKTIMACLSKDAAKRPPSARAVAEMLSLVPSQAEPPLQVATVAQAPMPGSRKLWMIAAAAALVLLGSAGYLGIRSQQRRRTAEFAQKQEEQRLKAEAAQLHSDEEKLKADLAATAAAQKAADDRKGQAAAALGGLTVTTTPPGAEVRVGTLMPGKSPLSLTGQKPGLFPVRIQLAGYETWNGEIEVKAGVPAQLSVSLKKSPAPPPGAPVVGRWSWPVVARGASSGEEITLVLYPRDGRLAGSVITPRQLVGSGTVLVLGDLSFKNHSLSFSLRRDVLGYRIVNRFSGRLEGNVIRGTVEAEGRNGQIVRRYWQARRSQ